MWHLTVNTPSLSSSHTAALRCVKCVCVCLVLRKGRVGFGKERWYETVCRTSQGLSSQEGKDCCMLTQILYKNNIHTLIHTWWWWWGVGGVGGCATASTFKERVQSGGKYPGHSCSVPLEPNYWCSANPSVGEVCVFLQMFFFFFMWRILNE